MFYRFISTFISLNLKLSEIMKNYNFARISISVFVVFYFLTNVLIIFLFKGIIGKCEPNLLKICQPLHFIVSVI